MFFYYNNQDSPSTTTPIRVGWIYWVGQRFLIATAEPQHALYCMGSADPLLNWDAAKSVCQQLFLYSGSPTNTAVIAEPRTAKLQLLMLYLRQTHIVRQEYDPWSHAPLGINTWIGHYGMTTYWMSGAVVSYNNFLTDNPLGDYPSLMDANGNWKSANSYEEHSYCCESNGLGSIAQMASGLIQVKYRAPNVMGTVINRTMDFDSSNFLLFSDDVELPTDSRMAYGLVVAIHIPDCTGGFRLLVPFETNSSVAVTHDVERCHVHITFVNTSLSVPIMTMNLYARQIRVINVGGTRPAAGKTGTPFRVVWSYLLEGGVNPYVANFPIPHLYQCFYKQAAPLQAHDYCAAVWGGEGYMATLVYSWEQSLVKYLRSAKTYADDVWIGLSTDDKTVWTNGEAVAYKNWALNEPSQVNAPVVLSAEDGSWRSVKAGSANHSFCCERTLNLEAVSGFAFNITPMVSAAANSEVQSRITYNSKEKFYPFKYLMAHVDANIADQYVYGVTVQVAAEVCRTNSSAFRLFYDASQLPARHIMCPSDACPAPQLTKACALMFTRDDGYTSLSSDFLNMLVNIQFTTDMVMMPNSQIRIGWALWQNKGFSRVVLNPSSGHQYMCTQSSLLSFVDALSACRAWNGDGYLVTIQSVIEDELFTLTRKASNGFTDSYGNDVWIGHRLANSVWVNSDPLNYTRWMAGQPDRTGPTIAKTDGTWSNVEEYYLIIRTTKNYCCERDGYRGFAASYSGWVTVAGRTLTNTITRTRNTKSSVATRSKELRETKTLSLSKRIIRFETDTLTITGRTDLITKSIGVTVTKTDDTATLTPSDSFHTVTASASESPTFGAEANPTVEPIKQTEIYEDAKKSIYQDVDGDAIRGIVDEKKDPAYRQVSFHIKGNWWRAGSSGAFWLSKVSIVPRLATLFGFSALKDSLITDQSFIVNNTVLTIQFQINDIYDIGENEILSVTIQKSATYLQGDAAVGTFPPFLIRVLAGGEATPLATFAITIATGVAALGSLSAFKDQQAMVIFGTMKCARGPSRTVFRAGRRIVSPARYGDELWAPWAGAFGPSFVAVWVHMLYVAFLLRWNVQETDIEEELIRARFPSLSLFVVQMLHIGVVYYSVELLKDIQSKLWMAMAIWGCAYSGVLTVLIFYWSFKYKLMKFEEYNDSQMLNVPMVLKSIIPFGRWGPKAPRRMCRWIVGEFHYQRYASWEYIMYGGTALFAAWMPSDLDTCKWQYSIMAGYHFLCALIVLGLRPFRSHFNNLTCFLSYVGLGLFLLMSATLVYYPFGWGYTGTNTVRWVMTGLCLGRGLVGVIVWRLENKLVGVRVKKIELEQTRQKHQQMLLRVLDRGDGSPISSSSSDEDGASPRKRASPMHLNSFFCDTPINPITELEKGPADKASSKDARSEKRTADISSSSSESTLDDAPAAKSRKKKPGAKEDKTVVLDTPLLNKKRNNDDEEMVAFDEVGIPIPLFLGPSSQQQAVYPNNMTEVERRTALVSLLEARDGGEVGTTAAIDTFGDHRDEHMPKWL